MNWCDRSLREITSAATSSLLIGKVVVVFPVAAKAARSMEGCRTRRGREVGPDRPDSDAVWSDDIQIKIDQAAVVGGRPVGNAVRIVASGAGGDFYMPRVLFETQLAASLALLFRRGDAGNPWICFLLRPRRRLRGSAHELMAMLTP